MSMYILYYDICDLSYTITVLYKRQNKLNFIYIYIYSILLILKKKKNLCVFSDYLNLAWKSKLTQTPNHPLDYDFLNLSDSVSIVVIVYLRYSFKFHPFLD